MNRVHPPIINVGPVTFAPWLEAVKNTANAKVQLLHFHGTNRGDGVSQFLAKPNTLMDFLRVEGTAVLELIESPLNDRLDLGSSA